MEEIEHKGVAYDTFLAVTRDLSPFKRWALRCRTMLAITRRFLTSRARDMSILFKQDGINNLHTWGRAATYLLISPGLLRQVFLPWLAFFRPSFHPWEHDDRALLDRGEFTVAAATA
jgi:predicted metal-dependent hydrolase